jgi:hypothetical protein
MIMVIRGNSWQTTETRAAHTGLEVNIRFHGTFLFIRFWPICSGVFATVMKLCGEFLGIFRRIFFCQRQFGGRDAILFAGFVRTGHNVDEHKEEAGECRNVEDRGPTPEEGTLGTKGPSGWHNQQGPFKVQREGGENLIQLEFPVIILFKFISNVWPEL